MAVFVIILDETNSEITERIKENYADHYVLSNQSFLVNSNGLTNEVAETIGIRGKNRIEGSSGVVFKLNRAYSGYFNRSLWEWLDQWE